MTKLAYELVQVEEFTGKLRRNIPDEVGCLERRVNSARGAIAILAAATALEACLERPSHKVFLSNQQEECNCFSIIANYCVPWTIARTYVIKKITIAATPLAECTPSPNIQSEGCGCPEEGCLGLPGVFPDIF